MASGTLGSWIEEDVSMEMENPPGMLVSGSAPLAWLTGGIASGGLCSGAILSGMVGTYGFSYTPGVIGPASMIVNNCDEATHRELHDCLSIVGWQLARASRQNGKIVVEAYSGMTKGIFEFWTIADFKASMGSYSKPGPRKVVMS